MLPKGKEAILHYVEKAANRPGALQALEDPSNPKTYLDNPQSLCIPVSQNEIDTNPNF